MRRKFTNNYVDQQIKNRAIKRNENVLSSKVKISWKCDMCTFIWFASPENVIRNNSGCPNCYIINSKWTDEKLSQKLNGRNIINVDSINKVNVNQRITWKCLMCDNLWKATTHDIIDKQIGCKKCYDISRRVTIEKISERLKNRNIKLLGNPQKSLDIVKWKCTKCSFEWNASTNNILNAHSGCPSCVTKPYSLKSIEWLETVSSYNNINIQHAENLGEYILPELMLKVDGYCKETKTVYEFYGDYWHGNPTKYLTTKKHPHYKKFTFGEIYEKTLIREQQIIENGYNIITIWESEYDNTKRNKKKKTELPE